jgi:hypothetical protein
VYQVDPPETAVQADWSDSLGAYRGLYVSMKFPT